MWAKRLRAFQVGKARTSHEGPWSWMRRSRVASAPAQLPACHLTKTSASAVAYGDHIYRRLAELKAKYAPDNAFHHNKNIPPR